MDTKLNLIIKSIDISRLFATKRDHGISCNNSNWNIFEPSKFVYSFFSFNMLYEIDWEETLRKERIWDSREMGNSSNKIYKLLIFIYTNQSDSTKEFIDYYRQYDPEMSIINNSNSIEPDYNIKRIDKVNFLKSKNSYLENFKSSLDKMNSSEFNIIEHYKLLIFCYQIRNNIFHGNKKATKMIEKGQRDRLLNYSGIILATIDMFFEILEKKYGYKPAREYELEDNAQTRRYRY